MNRTDSTDGDNIFIQHYDKVTIDIYIYFPVLWNEIQYTILNGFLSYGSRLRRGRNCSELLCASVLASSVVLVEGIVLVSVIAVVLVSTNSVVRMRGDVVCSILASDAEVDSVTSSVVVASTGCSEATEVPPIPRYLIWIQHIFFTFLTGFLCKE